MATLHVRAPSHAWFCTFALLLLAGCIVRSITASSFFVSVVKHAVTPRFALNGKPLRFSGINAHWLMQMEAAGDYAMVDSTLDRAAAMGQKVVRTHAFADGVPTSGGVALQSAAGVYQESTFQALDAVLDKCRQRGIKVCLSGCL